MNMASLSYGFGYRYTISTCLLLNRYKNNHALVPVQRPQEEQQALVGGKVALLPIALGTVDFLGIELCLKTCCTILLKSMSNRIYDVSRRPQGIWDVTIF